MSIKRLKYFFLLNILPPIIYIIISFIKFTSQIKHINSEPAHEMWDKGENSIVCFWHGRLLMMPFANRRGKGKVLISRHRDGEFIAKVMKYFGIGAVRGSYRKEGGISSLREIISDLKNGYDVAVTPDGPKGPKYTVKNGIIELARLTGKAIIPISYSASKKKLFIHGIVLLSPVPFQKFCLPGGSLFL
ncbi:MAG: lysophospholipid acyltransferase family protein [Proteobacteria bacterium]|nr:lysophospholipid acyltransferase family protein [Pseudomonadota bacterium]